MASAFTNYFANMVLNKYLLTSGNVYLGLFTADPGATGLLVNEVAGGSYVRQKYTASSPSASSVGNTAAIIFDNLPAVTVTWFALCDAQYGGNMLLRGAVTALVIPNSARLNIAIADVVWTL